MFNAKNIRNIAIIAHIDHGKTTLLDSLLKQSQIFHDHEKIPERVMDSYDQEKERGITIFAKHTSIFYQDYKINIIDTPGHADFSGEVERVLGMVNSVLLLVDAKEGPMPQTRFVLMKSLKMGLRPIVILNKIDRPHVDPERALNLTFDLFSELGATDEQLDFAYCYASGLSGFAMMKLDDPRKDMKPLFDLIVKEVPAPTGDINAPFLMQAATIGYDDYVGRQGIGRILAGVVTKGMSIDRINKNGERKTFKVQRIEGHHGLKKVEMEEAGVGDIVTISGIEDVTISDTLCAIDNTVILPPIAVEEPTLSIDFMVNSGPFSGKDGKNLTINKIRDRLLREKKANVTLKIDTYEDVVDKITVSGRGELHLAVLIEAMRREDYEFIVSKPQVIIKEIDGVKSEPMEMSHIEVPSEFSGAVISELGIRKGEMQSLDTDEHGITRMEFLIPTRGLMGCASELLTLTRGLVIMTSIFDHYAPWKGALPGRKRGVMISIGSGVTNAYACFGLQERSVLFVKPGDEVYEGMIVGENSRDNDLIVNVTKAKQLTNVRAAGKDENILLIPPRTFTLEQAINFISEDEYVEITPKNIRLRKKYLNENDRKRYSRQSS
ncbi:MAG: translational GTPase TypA [Chlamydiae bacterium]|nr:translational GTPase TypA [Chlamydiota bacterium]